MFEEYLALPDGAGRFPQGVSDLAVLRVLLCIRLLLLRDYHPLWCNFPDASNGNLKSILQPCNPREASLSGLGCFRFARHYSGNHLIVFSSWGYLDVSVLPVRLLLLV